MEQPDKYVKMALEMGARDSRVISIDDIVFDPRSLLKCMYGCRDWGTRWTCPSSSKGLKPWEAERILKRYQWGLLIHTNNPTRAHEIALEVERNAFLDGYPFALSLIDCYVCDSCAFPDPCRFPKKSRPELQAMGIDVYSTVKQQGLPIQPLKTRNDTPNYYALVLIE